MPESRSGLDVYPEHGRKFAINPQFAIKQSFDPKILIPPAYSGIEIRTININALANCGTLVKKTNTIGR